MHLHQEFEELILHRFAPFKPYGFSKDLLQIYRAYYRDEIAACFSCGRKGSVEWLWSRRREISDTAQRLGIKWIILCLGGKVFYPPWRATTYSSIKSMIHQPQLTLSDGDIAKRILDSGLSCGVVDINANILLCASQEIATTSGQDAFAIQGKSLDDLWDKQVLADLNRELKQQGRLEDVYYRARSWVQKDGIWQTEERNFHAQSIEVVKFLGRWCRLTYGIEISD
jgi:hypothetical protein